MHLIFSLVLVPLLPHALKPPCANETSYSQEDETPAAFVTLGQLLLKFDDEWLEYLDEFVLWKGQDAVSLEGELIG